MARRIQQALYVNSVDQSPFGTGNGVDFPGGIGKLFVDATFGGGSVALQMLSPSGVWLGLDSYAQTAAISLTANGVATFIAPAGRVRVLITTATAVNAYIIGCPENGAG